MPGSGVLSIIFQSTHPLRGATGRGDEKKQYVLISIHAPLAGCDALYTTLFINSKISIHAPLAGCDPSRHFFSKGPLHFNPRTPCGVRQRLDELHVEFESISIHAPLAGCDHRHPGQDDGAADHFNPRTPCGVRRRVSVSCSIRPDFNPRTPCGVRPWPAPIKRSCILFQSTHPLRGATAKAHKKMRHFCAKGINTSSLCAKNAHPAT